MSDSDDAIATDPRLKSLRDRATASLGSHVADGYAISPLLIIALLSLAIQIIRYCQEKRDNDTIRADLKKWPRVFGFQALRARREMRRLLRDHNLSAATDELLNLGSTLTDEEIDGLLAAAAR